MNTNAITKQTSSVRSGNDFFFSPQKQTSETRLAEIEYQSKPCTSLFTSPALPDIKNGNYQKQYQLPVFDNRSTTDGTEHELAK